jgi:hypothetical protein
MEQSQLTLSRMRICSSIFMVLALLWLTISTPFVYEAQKVQNETQKQTKQGEQNPNPFANTTEEKNESSVNTLSEYLHDPLSIETDFIVLTRLYQRYPFIIYPEHHPELLSPPPEG